MERRRKDLILLEDIQFLLERLESHGERFAYDYPESYSLIQDLLRRIRLDYN